ncbi:hypothetical protein O2N63_11225 [Aliiroseovarius sp. KMU-50]|uniref:Uncharacterized protein n=1 Tax=Aliiroseovarius salicola TaxID=3009082 RepID=A0ABT4W2E8_9RHOB|nr:hypothetical protein [Aliiroseovarius sp. KMU-50]MDA5094656.1 hypothetical protein [Aliiroseovarius sp. KMU-50]
MSASWTDMPIETLSPTTPELVEGENVISTATYTYQILQELEAEGIRFCHWKSNIRLADTLAGREDIDLLVDRRDAVDFLSELSKHDFKLAKSRFGTDHPGIFHALGLDEALGEVVDVHAHHWVLSGDSFVKNFRFPVVEPLLEGRQRFLGVPVPSPEAEYLLFVLRIVLKSVAPVEILKANLKYGIVVDEINWLRTRADREGVEALRAEWFPSVSENLFREAEEAVAAKNAMARRFGVGVRVAWQLRNIRRLGSALSLLSHVRRLAAYTLARFQKRKDRVLHSGGLIIALVGPKATGKSTLSNALAKRLGRHLDVIRIHAGKPPVTVIGFLPRLLLPIARRLLPHERLREYEKPERRKKKRYSIFYILRMTLLAYERRSLLRKALRYATRGTIVISDRYPSDQAGAIDSNRFDSEAIAQEGSAFKRYLMKLEKRMYQDVPKPDLVLRLQAPIEVALQRDGTRQKTGGPDANSVRRRWSLEQDIHYAGIPVVAINTAQSIEDTSVDAMKAVWGAM